MFWGSIQKVAMPQGDHSTQSYEQYIEFSSGNKSVPPSLSCPKYSLQDCVTGFQLSLLWRYLHTFNILTLHINSPFLPPSGALPFCLLTRDSYCSRRWSVTSTACSFLSTRTFIHSLMCTFINLNYPDAYQVLDMALNWRNRSQYSLPQTQIL